MKKHNLILLLAIGTVMISCKKEYACKCSKTYTTSTGSTTKDYSMYTYKDTKGSADSRCNENEKSGTDGGGNFSINCDIQ